VIIVSWSGVLVFVPPLDEAREAVVRMLTEAVTGIAGVTGILCALMRRAEEGGSFKVDVALNYYNQWLANSVGDYPEPVWQDVWERNGKQVFR
jgi:crotonobetainyl-CoA:carnitine CoA-transferase CaiB-like acyl-CoA transferase